ncbi:ATP-binding cassette domain-containing protein [Sinorhizobium medicae]|nr:ATP-binding cassette domain-containing protein [Sinorhizobium medicae]
MTQILRDSGASFEKCPALSVSGLEIIRKGGRADRLVRGINFTVGSSRTLAIVGESGSGKSLTCKAIAGLLDPRLAASGEIFMHDRLLSGLRERDWNNIRGRDIGYVFQNPFTALNPVLPIGRQISEALRVHGKLRGRAAAMEAKRILDLVRIGDPGRRMQEYPHHLSGGMCQRVAIAMAIACKPKLLIADEPTTALDVTVQAEILDLLEDLQQALGVALIIVTHDLGVAARIAHDVVVMYGGTIMEKGPTSQVLSNPRHPYTLALLRSSPVNATKGRPLYTIPGSVSHLGGNPRGCVFVGRCDRATQECSIDTPQLQFVAGAQGASCHLVGVRNIAA